jgi:hypothetical protein
LSFCYAFLKKASGFLLRFFQKGIGVFATLFFKKRHAFSKKASGFLLRFFLKSV